MKKLLRKLINEIKSKLSCITKDTESESWWLIEKLTKKSKAQLITEEEIELSEDQETQLNNWVEQRTEQKKPLQYILGSVPFCGLEILVETPILIPRPETEEWCNWLIKEFQRISHVGHMPDMAQKQKNSAIGFKQKGATDPEQTENSLNIKPTGRTAVVFNVLDLCAGSGCIALSIAKAFPKSKVLGTDINPKSIELCNKNKEHNQIENTIFTESDLYKNLQFYENSFDLIVSNPPYISENEFENLSPEVSKWEDKNALVSGSSGLEIIEEIIKHAKTYLKRESIFDKYKLPRIVLEFGTGQDSEVKKLLEKYEFKNMQIHQDMEKVNRWSSATTS